MYERFTDRARRVVVLSQEEARIEGRSSIGTEHTLLGLLHEGEGVAAQALESLGVTLDKTRAAVEAATGAFGEPANGHIPLEPATKKIYELALREALMLGHGYIGTEHLLLGLIRYGQGVAVDVLVEAVGDLARVRNAVINAIGGPMRPPRDDRPPERTHTLVVQYVGPASARRARYMADVFWTDSMGDDVSLVAFGPGDLDVAVGEGWELRRRYRNPDGA